LRTGYLGPKRDEVVGGWRKLEMSSILGTLHHILIRLIKSRRIMWAGHVACMVEIRNVCKILFGKPEGMRPLGKSGHI
jgi:hypothetical protein